MVETISATAPPTAYVLPHASNSTEALRLDKQHAMFRLLFNGLPMPCPDLVKEVLKEEIEKPKLVLDLGSGSGAWCIDMAHQFPHVEVVGLDIAPNSLQAIPPNCKFELWDLNNPLSQFYGRFDLVHMRFVHGLKEHRATMLEAEKCLKPGGLIVFFLAGPTVTQNRLTAYPPASSRMSDGSWFQRFWYLTQLGCTLQGDVKAKTIHDYDEGLWDHEIMDPNTCGAAYITAPVGPWAKSPDPAETARLVEIGNFWKRNMMTIHRLLDAMLVAAGRTPEDIENLHTRIDEDLTSNRPHMSVTIRSIWGCTRASEDSIIRREMPLEDADKPSPLISAEKDGYQIMTVFKDKESWCTNNVSFKSSMNSDTKSLLEVMGFDPIEA